MEDGEKSLRDYASPRSEDFDMQKSDSVLRATEYEIKHQIIKMAAANPFRGDETDNPYRHTSGSQCYATRYNKMEFRQLGLDGIFFHTHLRKKREDGLHLHPSR